MRFACKIAALLFSHRLQSCSIFGNKQQLSLMSFSRPCTTSTWKMLQQMENPSWIAPICIPNGKTLILATGFSNGKYSSWMMAAWQKWHLKQISWRTTQISQRVPGSIWHPKPGMRHQGNCKKIKAFEWHGPVGPKLQWRWSAADPEWGQATACSRGWTLEIFDCCREPHTTKYESVAAMLKLRC